MYKCNNCQCNTIASIEERPTNLEKWKYTLYTIVIFVVIMSSKMVDVIKTFTRKANNIFIIQTIIFTLVLRLVMG